MRLSKVLLGTFIFTILASFVITSWKSSVFAQENTPPHYNRAKIIDVQTSEISPSQQSDTSNTAQKFYTQTITFQPAGSSDTYEVLQGSEFQPITENQLLKVGQTVIIQSQTYADTQEKNFSIIDTYRVTPWIFLVGIFLVLVFFVARWQGVLSIIGMTLTIGVLALFLIPAFLQGYDPLLVSILGAVVLAGITLYVTHGWSLSTHIAFFSVVGVLVLVGFISYGSVLSMHLTGLGTEEALFIQFLSGSGVQLQGLLLGGILLGTLGVLDDIVVSQIAVVEELFASKPKITFSELFQRSLRVGRTHVASLVNTLVLVYAGANLPLFLLFSQNSEPLWVTLNSQLIMEEMVRTLSGSIGLILAVPIATFLSAGSLMFLPRILSEQALQKTTQKKKHIHHHSH